MGQIDDILHHDECVSLLSDFEAEELEDSRYLIIISLKINGGYNVRCTPSLPAVSYFGVLKLAEASFLEQIP